MSPYAVLAAAGLLMALLTGCGGDSPSAGKSGYRSFERDGVALAYPASWEKEQGKELLNAHGEVGEDGLDVRLRLLKGERSSFPSALSLGKSIADSRPSELPGGRLVKDDRATVKGADGAWRIVTDYKAKDKDGKDVAARLDEVVAVTPDQEVTVTVAGPKRLLDSLDLKRILGSLRVK